MTTHTDSLLLQQFLEGDEAGFEELFRRHYNMVYGVLFRLTGTRQEAEDLAQEVFVKLYKRPMRHSDNVAGWLYRVAINTGYNALRSAQRRTRREEVAGREQSRPPYPEAEVTRREEQAQVRRALAQLPPRAAKLLVLRELGFNYREMAEVVGVAPGSIGTLLARAQKAFQKAYGTGEEGEPA